MARLENIEFDVTVRYGDDNTQGGDNTAREERREVMSEIKRLKGKKELTPKDFKISEDMIDELEKRLRDRRRQRRMENREEDDEISFGSEVAGVFDMVESKEDRVRKEREMQQREEEKRLMEEMRERARLQAQIESGVQGVPGALADPRSFLVGQAFGAARFIPHAFVLFMAKEVFEIIRDTYFGPGGPGDVRFKRIASEQIQAFQDRRERADLAVKRAVVTTSTLGDLRGAAASGKVGGTNYTDVIIERDDLLRSGRP